MFELETHGYHDGRYGPVVSRYYFDDKEKDVLVSEVSFNKEMMLRVYVATKGIPRLIAGLIKMALESAEQGDVITKQDLANVFSKTSIEFCYEQYNTIRYFING